MSNLAYAPVLPRFYRHSGKVPPAAWIAGTLTAIASGLILGAAFGVASFFGHLIPFAKLFLIVEVGLPFAFGYGLGLLPARVLRRQKGRSTLTAMAMAFLASAVGLYVTWIAYLYTLFAYLENPIPLTTLLDPLKFGHIISTLAEVGVWEIDKDIHPQGIFLWIMWSLEAAVIVGTALVTARKTLNAFVFCEQCKTWGTLKTLAQLDVADQDRLTHDLAAGNTQSLATAKKASAAAMNWLSLSLEGCAACDGPQALNLTRITLVPNKKGSSAIKRKTLVNRAILTPEATGDLLLAVATITAPPPPPEPTPADPAPPTSPAP